LRQEQEETIPTARNLEKEALNAMTPLCLSLPMIHTY